MAWTNTNAEKCVVQLTDCEDKIRLLRLDLRTPLIDRLSFMMILDAPCTCQTRPEVCPSNPLEGSGGSHQFLGCKGPVVDSLFHGASMGWRARSSGVSSAGVGVQQIMSLSNID